MKESPENMVRVKDALGSDSGIAKDGEVEEEVEEEAEEEAEEEEAEEEALGTLDAQTGSRVCFMVGVL